tara:strand:- start:365 stop:820 length:456 start_codon:yes stop_codon:yes gene_type:complete
METTERKRGFLFSVISYVSLVSYNSTKKGAKRDPNFYNVFMKKFTLILIFSILITNCSQDNIANDSERNWCIGKAQRADNLLLFMKSDNNEALRTEYFDIISEIGTAEIIYRNDYDSNPPGLLKVKEELLSNDEEALRFCKIWTDISADNE